MRLFIAITFNEIIKNELVSVIETLRQHTIRGKFTQKENLHLTLEFIGETANCRAVSRAMDSMNGRKFELEVGGMGCFNRDGGKVCWIGVEQSEELMELQENVHSALLKEGFRLDSRSYKPHLTLGREVILENGFDLAVLNGALPQLKMGVKRVCLMKSERIAGKLVYTEVESAWLT